VNKELQIQYDSLREEMKMELERKIIAGIVICGVAVAFIVISALVILTGRNAYFVKKKLAVGAILLSLSAIMSGCKGPGPVGSSCYVSPYYEERVTFDVVKNNQIVLDRKVTDTIHCTITESTSGKYSIMILDSINTVVKKETVYSDTTWKFLNNIYIAIVFDRIIPNGTYSLRLFNQDADSVKSGDDYQYIYTLKIVN
jgi:hypothetical protein